MIDSADGIAPGDSAPPASYLFLVRLWAEEDAGGQTEWCGKVQQVTSGDARTFRDWSSLVTLLLTMLPGAQADAPLADTRAAADPAAPIATPCT